MSTPVADAFSSDDTAFLLVGQTRSLSSAQLQRYRRHVVEVLGGDVFVLLKASSHEVARLERAVLRILRPVVANVSTDDHSARRFAEMSHRVEECLWPPSLGGYAGGRNLLRGRISRWWGALQLAHEMVEWRERVRRQQYARVVMSRADVDWLAPLPASVAAAPGAWHSAAEPPDAFWALPRRFARYALQTITLAAECAPA